MALNNVGLGIIFSATDNASGVIGLVARNFLRLDTITDRVTDNIAKKIGATGAMVTRSLKTMAVGAGIATVGFMGLSAAFGAPIKNAATLEDTMISIQQKTNFTGKQIAMLREEFIKLSSDLPLSAQELARVGVIASQLGVRSIEGIKDLAFVSAQLARVSDLTEEGAAKALATMTGLFKISIQEADRAASSMFKLAATTRATASQIATTTNTFAGLAEKFNLTVAQAQAFSATLIEGGRGSREAATSFQRLFTLMGGSNLSDFAARLGMTNQEFQTLLDNDPTEAMLRFLGSLRGLSGVQTTQVLRELGVVSQRTIGSTLALVSQFDKLKVNLQNATQAFGEGTALQIAFEQRLQTLNARIDTFVGKVKNIGIAIGTILLPIAKTAVDALSVLADLFFLLPEGVRNFSAFSFVVASAILAVSGLITVLVGLAPLVIPFVKPLIPIFLGIVAALTIATAAAMALRTAWVTNFGGIRDFVLPILQDISLAYRSLMKLFTDGEIVGALADELTAAGNEGVFAFVDFVSRSVVFLRETFMGIVDGAADAFQPLGVILSSVFGQIGDLFNETASLFVEAFGPIFEALGFQAPTQAGLTNIRFLSRVLTQMILSPLVSIINFVAILINGFLALSRVAIFLGRAFAVTFGPIVRVTGFLLRWVLPFSSQMFALVDQVHMLGDAWKNVESVITIVLAGIEVAVRSTFNAMIDQLNMVIKLMTTVLKMTTPVASLLSLVGAFPEFQIPKLDQTSTLAQRGFELQVGSSQPAVPKMTSSSPVPASGPKIPESAPVNRQQQGPATNIAEEVERGMRAGMMSARSRPMNFEGEVTLNGESVGGAMAKAERQENGRRGRPLSSFRRGG